MISKAVSVITNSQFSNLKLHENIILKCLWISSSMKSSDIIFTCFSFEMLRLWIVKNADNNRSLMKFAYFDRGMQLICKTSHLMGDNSDNVTFI